MNTEVNLPLLHEAVAWVDQLGVDDHMDCGCFDTLKTLAAAARRLPALLDELGALKARTCETCRFRERDYCLNESVGTDLFEVECAVVRFCGAWAAKEQA